MVSVAAHAYPWDVIGDPAFPARVADHGIEDVTLAAAYHSVRAATPLHPRHQIVHARHSALYRRYRDDLWRGRRLVPAAAPWCPDKAFDGAATTLGAAGLKVNAWIVLTHNSLLGTAFPDVTVVNCFGDSYPYALCPARAEVRDYAAALAVAAVDGLPVDGVSLESCGQLGVAHQDHHDKTAGAWSPEAERLLSVCCCTGCRAAWTTRGLDPHRVTAILRAGVRHGSPVPDDLTTALLAARHESADLLRRQVVAAVRETAPQAAITLHAHPDPWTLGAAPALTTSAINDVDEILVGAWSTAPASAGTVAQTVKAAAPKPVNAYVTLLPPAAPAELPDHVRRIAAAGASRVSLCHAGLVSAARQPLFAQLTAMLTAADP
ncbi:hypothetical protein [Streptomyces sp. NPDC055709]